MEVQKQQTKAIKRRTTCKKAANTTATSGARKESPSSGTVVTYLFKSRKSGLTSLQVFEVNMKKHVKKLHAG
jgi:hypothetical protein